MIDMTKLWRLPLQEYKGRTMGCAPGTHEAAVDLVLRHVGQRRGVLDLGARSGALLARLKDNGFSDLSAIDLDRHLFDLDDVALQIFDLNEEFASIFDRKFNLITCSEVMEHLDSPRSFAHNAHALLEDYGYLPITVPNIANWRGRIKFMLYGEHWGFGHKHHLNARHISPTTFEEITTTFEELGFRLVAETTAGDFDGPLRKAVTFPLRAALRMVGGRRCEGDSAVYLFAKDRPNEVLKRPTWYIEEWDASRAAVMTDREARAS